MERYIQTLKIKAFSNKGILLVLLLLAGFSFWSNKIFAQTPSVIRNIRLPLWAELDAYPGLEVSSDKNDEEQENWNQFDFPIKQIHKIAPFILSGMVYGWNFVYVPYDKARGVEEYLEVTEIVASDVIKGGIKYVSPWISDNNLNCWVEYTRTDSQVQNYNLWSSIQNPVIGGIGYSSVEKGFDGIEEAAREALKDAIRTYYRKTIKNKPKEINGAVLVRNFPTLGISSGRYVINLDFFLECGKIIEYSVY